MSGELWAVHILGPDDLLPCASRRLAARNATWTNLSGARSIPLLDDDAQPLVYAVPVPWDDDPKEHARFLAQEERADPRWSDPDADVLTDLARHEYAGWEDGKPPGCTTCTPATA